MRTQLHNIRTGRWNSVKEAATNQSAFKIKVSRRRKT